MKTFTEFKNLKEALNGVPSNDLESGTPTSNMRMGRPTSLTYDKLDNFVTQLQNPRNRENILSVLRAHPEMKEYLDKLFGLASYAGHVDRDSFNNIRNLQKSV